MSINKIEAGHYELGAFTILNGGSHWQVRDQFGDIEQQFNTLKKCVSYCLQFITKETAK